MHHYFLDFYLADLCNVLRELLKFSDCWKDYETDFKTFKGCNILVILKMILFVFAIIKFHWKKKTMTLKFQSIQQTPLPQIAFEYKVHLHGPKSWMIWLVLI